jgi:hypothetical protein
MKLYFLAVWAHIWVVCFWVGAMFFSDPQSTRFFSRMVEKIGGTGWYAHGVLWPTGFYMLYERGVMPADLFTSAFIATNWGKALWAKLILVLTLVAFQVVVGHKPSKLIFGYVLVAFAIIGLSVAIVRPVVM